MSEARMFVEQSRMHELFGGIVKRVGVREKENFKKFGFPQGYHGLEFSPIQNWMGHITIKDQRPAQACTSFAICSAIEGLHSIAGSPIYLDPGYIHFCLANLPGNLGLDLGFAIDLVLQNGVALQTGLPYPANPNLCGSYVVRPVTARCDLITTSVQAKQFLSRGPILAGMLIYEDFIHAYPYGKVYRPTPNSGNAWEHTVCIVGYDESERCWIGANSWGSGWGDQGFFKVAYGECYLLSDSAESYVGYAIR